MNESAQNRVPQIVLLYWIIKIASTTLGETGADMFSMTFSMGYGATIVVFTGVFLVLLGVKLYLRGYHPTVYWLVFTVSAIVGTVISDFIDRTLGLGYALGSVSLVVLLLIVLGLWWAMEKSISVERITTSSAEAFYWMAFLIANTLGTAAGDYLADGLGVGFLNSALLISALLGIVGILHFYTKVPGILLFWLAFVLTRPFGATFGDLLTKSIEQGGLDLGTVGASIFFGLILVYTIAKETKLERLRSSEQ